MLSQLNFLEVDWNLGINVTIVGIVIVFSMLVLLVAVLGIFGLVSGLATKPKKEKGVKSEVKVQNDTKVDDEVTAVITAAVAATSNDDIIPVIAAAVAAMYDGSPVKPIIRAVKKSGGNARPAWTEAGIFENTRAF